MRVLVIDDATKQRAAEILAYADQHHYYVGRTKTVPGDDPGHVANFNDYRAVFSYSHSHGRVYRHMTISVPGGAYPNPIAAYSLAEIFGFTGWDGKSVEVPGTWQVAINDNPVRHVVLAQEMEKVH